MIARLKEPSPQTGIQHHAPILAVPLVFEDAFCAHLIAQFEAGGGQTSGVMEDVAGKTSEIRDPDVKRRRDFPIADDPLRQEIWARLSRRLFPVIQQSFQFGVTHVERYLVACYEAEDAGFFAAHRDDTTLATAHRRFAVTINLNSDYDGGDLMFPEFGHRTYRAPPGGAVVFSCSLLHLVTPVLRGRRFAFLPFLHDPKAEAVRLQNQKFHSGEILQRN
jgi:predicted 2-oxoglutarate/Fe(II)-dependent dioxygenase YbiX